MDDIVCFLDSKLDPSQTNKEMSRCWTTTYVVQSRLTRRLIRSNVVVVTAQNQWAIIFSRKGTKLMTTAHDRKG